MVRLWLNQDVVGEEACVTQYLERLKEACRLGMENAHGVPLYVDVSMGTLCYCSIAYEQQQAAAAAAAAGQAPTLARGLTGRLLAAAQRTQSRDDVPADPVPISPADTQSSEQAVLSEPMVQADDEDEDAEARRMLKL